MQQEAIEKRKIRGLEIAQKSRITKTERGWKVPSQLGQGYYTVVLDGHGGKCGLSRLQEKTG